MKAIKLIDLPDCKWYILPTESLRDLVVRRLLDKYPHFNCVLKYVDRQGFGVEVYHSAGIPKGHVFYQY